MKRLLILCLLLALSLCACGGDIEKEAISAIGGADGPTAVTVAQPSSKDAPQDAYSYDETAK